jgi:RimJ/RimL family protein N-acetyltransferase
MPPFRGQGIAERLLGSMEQYLCHARVMRLRITALAANTSARACYQRAGFSPYEIVYES